VTTDQAGPYLKVIDELVPAAVHVTGQYGTDEIVKGPPLGQLPGSRPARSRGQGWPEATVGVALTPVRTGVASPLVGVVDPVAKCRDWGLALPRRLALRGLG
jgi:hypothetical protein